AAYLKLKVPPLSGLSVKGGVDEFKTVGGFTCGTELGLGLVNYKVDMLDLTLAYSKIWEPNTLDTKNDTTTEKNDATFYAADATLTLSDSIKIRPALYAIQGDKNQDNTISGVPFKGKTALVPTIGANLKFGSLGLDLAAAYGTCAKDENNVKYSGYMLDAAPSFKASDEFTLGGFFTMLSGDKATSTDKNESFKSFTLKQDGWGRLFLLENMQTYNNAGDHNFADVRSSSTGYMLFGANAAYKISAFEIKGQVGYARCSQVASGSKKDIGTEVDLAVSYEVEKNAKIIAEAAYLATGKAFEDAGALKKCTKKQNAMYSALGVMAKW
ncbi:MAG TPA: hypothetical protein PKK43_14815, partial [Spirochaetota bacterium]|nr:hypothetical protein [Spirochaetota bacterium]